jgi:hypothetical protein
MATVVDTDITEWVLAPGKEWSSGLQADPDDGFARSLVSANGTKWNFGAEPRAVPCSLIKRRMCHSVLAAFALVVLSKIL